MTASAPRAAANVAAQPAIPLSALNDLLSQYTGADGAPATVTVQGPAGPRVVTILRLLGGGEADPAAPTPSPTSE